MHRQGNHLHPGMPHLCNGHRCIPGAPARHTPQTAHGIAVAVHRATAALAAGRLLSPAEAMALAGTEARTKETLFSIARDVAWETQADQDQVLAELTRRFPDLG